MKCSYCDQTPEFKCECEMPFMCHNHLVMYLKENKNLNYEKIDIEYNDSRLNQIKSNIFENLRKVNNIKKDLHTKTTLLIKFIEKQLSTTLNHLEGTIKTYNQLLNRSKFCKSEIPEINQIEKMKLSVPFIEFDEIQNEVQKVHSQNFICYIESQPDWQAPFLKMNVGGFWCCAVANDNKTIVTGGYDSTIRAWDLFQRNQIFMLLGHNGYVRCITLNEDSTIIISGSSDASIRIWSFEQRNQIAVLKGHKGVIFTLIYMEKKSIIVSGDFYGEIIIWDCKKYQIIKKISVSHAVRCMIYIKNLRILIAAVGKNIFFYKFKGFKELKSLQGHTASVSCIAISNDQKFLVSGSLDYSIIIWDLEESIELTRLVGHSKGVESLILTPDCRYIVSGSHDTSIRIWEFSSGSLVHEFCDHTSFVHCIIKAGSNILSLSEDSNIGFIDIVKLTIKVRCFLIPFKYNSINYIPELKLVGYGSNIKAMVWNLERGVSKKLNLDQIYNVQYVDISKDGKFAICCSLGYEKNLIYYNLIKNTKIIDLIGHKDSVFCANFASDGKSAASGSLDYTVRTWNLEKCRQDFEFRGHTGLVNSVKFMNNKRLLASGGLDKIVIIWNLADKSKYAILSGHQQIIWKLVITDDENFVISCNSFEGVRVWNVEKRQLETKFSFETKAENWLNNNRIPVVLVKEFLKA